MKRFGHWPEALYGVLEDWHGVPFDWQGRDCASFVAAAITAMTGEDLLAPFRGQYSDAASARAALKAAGHASLYHYLVKTFGQPVHPSRAGRGDIALTKGEDGPALGIITGKDAVFVGEARIGDRSVQTGLIRIPTTDIKHCFKVPS